MAASRRYSVGSTARATLAAVLALAISASSCAFAADPSPTKSLDAAPTSSAKPSPAPPPPAEEQERDSSLALFLVLSLLIFSFFVSYYLRVKRITAIHETIVGLFAGMLVGAVLRIGPGQQVQQMLSFSNTIMLNVLLPPIILASGYDLRQENFFRNFGIILAFAFAGTFISAIVIGVLVYLWSLADFTISLSSLECLIFGSTLSATDPVTILAIFNTKKVDPTLYSIIFGESLLNDAVSIVMFDTLQTFRGQSISIYSIFHGLGLFLVVFTVSMVLGISFGLGCSLMLKHSRLSKYPQLESCLVALIAYTSYFFSNAVTMSGIVSLLFCGITLKHYAYHNMSRRTQRATRYTFQTLASLSENFIFIYLGLSLFTQEGLVFKPLFIVITVGIVVFSRYAAVFPIAAVINLIRRVRSQRNARSAGGGGLPRTGREEQLSREYQIMLFWAGLRGAVGFALSAGIEGKNAPALQTTVLVTIVLTLIVFGGTTSQMLDILGIRTGVQDDEGDSTDEEFDGPDGSLNMSVRSRNATRRSYARRRGAANGQRGFYQDDDDDANAGLVPKSAPAGARKFNSGQGQSAGGRYSYEDEVLSSQSSDDVLPSAPGARGSAGVDTDSFPEAFAGSDRVAGGARALLERGALIMRDGQWFQRIDDRYLKPYFSNAVASRKHEERKSLRAANRSASNLVPVSGPVTPTGSGDNAFTWGGSGGGAGAGQEAALWEAEAASREPDAVVVADEDDDDEGGGMEGGVTLALGAGSGAGSWRASTSGAASSSGRVTPRRTTGGSLSGPSESPAGGELEEAFKGHTRDRSRMGSSNGVGGAFDPSQ